MAFYTQQMIRVVDADATMINNSNDNTVVQQVIVLSHEALPLGQNPEFTIDGQVVSVGLPGSGADYELKRISDKQTVVIKNVATPSVVVKMTTQAYVPPNQGGPAPIGDAIIGESFIVS